MDSRPFDELHYARYEDVLAVAYPIDLTFLSDYVFVYEHRLILIHCDCASEICEEAFVTRDYLHGSSAKHI